MINSKYKDIYHEILRRADVSVDRVPEFDKLVKNKNFDKINAILPLDNIARRLKFSCKYGYLDDLKYLYEEKNVDFNTHDTEEACPLSFAVFSGHTDVVDYLLEKGADINPDYISESYHPVSAAIYADNIEILEYILKKGAKAFKIKNDDSWIWENVYHSPVFLAVVSNNVKAVSCILKNHMNDQGFDQMLSFIMIAAIESDSVNVFDFVLNEYNPIILSESLLTKALKEWDDLENNTKLFTEIFLMSLFLGSTGMMEYIYTKHNQHLFLENTGCLDFITAAIINCLLKNTKNTIDTALSALKIIDFPKHKENFTQKELEFILKIFSHSGSLDGVKIILENINIAPKVLMEVFETSILSSLEIAKYLLEKNMFIKNIRINDAIFEKLQTWGNKIIINDFIKQIPENLYGDNPKYLTLLEYNLSSEAIDKTEAWNKNYKNFDLPLILSTYTPHKMNMDVFGFVQYAAEEENVRKDLGILCAYHVASVFPSMNDLKKYLLKYINPEKELPFFDLLENIKVPQSGNIHFKAWSDAIIKHGPKMADLLKKSDSYLTEPQKSKDGCWSYKLTREALWEGFAQKTDQTNPDLSRLCFEYNWSKSDFEMAVDVIKEHKNKKENKIPEVTIEGALFNKDGYIFKKLPDGDVRALFLGEMTDCCQYLSGNGKVPTENGFLSEYAGFYVVEKIKTNEIVAQSWAWRGKNKELVLDSFESLKGHFNKESCQSLLEIFAKESMSADPTISRILMGVGFKLVEGKKDLDFVSELDFCETTRPAKAIDHQYYVDSKRQYHIAPYINVSL
jgi:ankyrin repeat protein